MLKETTRHFTGVRKGRTRHLQQGRFQVGRGINFSTVRNRLPEEGCAVCMLGSFQDLTGSRTGQPGMMLWLTLLWAGGWARDLLDPFQPELTCAPTIKRRHYGFQPTFHSARKGIFLWELMGLKSNTKHSTKVSFQDSGLAAISSQWVVFV